MWKGVYRTPRGGFMKGTVILFGNRYQISERVKNLGYEIILVDFTNPDGFSSFIELPTEQARDSNWSWDLFSSLSTKKIAGIIAVEELYVEIASLVREKFFPHLPGPPSSITKLGRDKLLLKMKLRELNIPTPRFSEISIHPFLQLTEKVGLPFLVKPRRERLAIGIKKITSEAEWNLWLDKSPNPSDYHVEEEMQDFQEFCCDTFISDHKVLAQFPGEYSIPCLQSNLEHDGFGVLFSGGISSEKINELKNLARRFCEGISIADGYLHLEFFLSKGTWYFGEAGMRYGGGYQVPTESYMAGADLLDWFAKLWLPLETKPTKAITEMKEDYVGYYLYPKKSGRIKTITSDFEYPWILETQILVKEGETLFLENSSVSKSAVVVFKADSLSQLQERARRVPGLFRIEYETP
jgi:hypothetical protein